MTIILALLLLVMLGMPVPRPLRDTPVDHGVQAMKAELDHHLQRGAGS